MMARGSGAVVAALGTALGAALFVLANVACSQEAWHTMTGPERSFSADLPAAPKYTPTQMTTPVGVPYTMHQYQLEQGQTGYVVQYVVYPKDVNVANAQTVLQASLERTAKGMDGGKWASIAFPRHQGLPAADAVALRAGSEIRSYSVLKGRQLFSLVYVGPPGSARSADAERFVASLKLGPLPGQAPAQ